MTGPGIRLKPGARLETSNDSRAALVLIDGTTIRFDRATVAVREGRSRMLERGAGTSSQTGCRRGVRASRRDGSVVRHLGRSSRCGRRRLDARPVREGLVAVERGATRWTTAAGEHWWCGHRHTDPGTHRDVLIRVALGPRTSEPFNPQGATVQAFLDGISHERVGTGRSRRHASREGRPRRAPRSIEGLTPERPCPPSCQRRG